MITELRVLDTYCEFDDSNMGKAIVCTSSTYYGRTANCITDCKNFYKDRFKDFRGLDNDNKCIILEV